jgi:hypothetical protein
MNLTNEDMTRSIDNDMDSIDPIENMVITNSDLKPEVRNFVKLHLQSTPKSSKEKLAPHRRH